MAIETSFEKPTETPIKEKFSRPNGGSEDVSISDAVQQIKSAATSVCDAVSSFGSSSASQAKVKMETGKIRAQELGLKAEEAIKDRPLVTVGVAFAAGWLISRLVLGSRRGS